MGRGSKPKPKPSPNPNPNPDEWWAMPEWWGAGIKDQRGIRQALEQLGYDSYIHVVLALEQPTARTY